MRPRVAVIGGGITGLSAAQEVAKHAPAADVVVLEAANRLGGVLETVHRDGFLIEAAADSFLTSPAAAVDLCRAIGLENHLISTKSARRRSFVIRNGHLRPIPAGFVAMAPGRLGPMLSSRVLSWPGKVRLGCEYFVPRKTSDEDESVASFVCRRFGREVLERLVQPLIGGIYAGDPELLSIEATMPRIRQIEREYGSLIRASFRTRPGRPIENGRGARYTQFVALRNGMSSLIDALAQRLQPRSVQLASPVNSIFRLEGDRWLLLIEGAKPRPMQVDAVIVATPAYTTAKLLAGVEPTIARDLKQVEYSSSAIVSLGYKREQIKQSLNGFGFVVPIVERRNILSCSYSSIKYDGRAPQGAVLLRVFIGGACQGGLLRLADDELIELAQCEVGDILGINGDPTLRYLTRRPRAMPQYHIGHRQRMDNISKRLARFPTLTLAGSAYGGVGIPACIQSGQSAAQRILSRLKPVPSWPRLVRAEAEASL